MRVAHDRSQSASRDSLNLFHARQVSRVDLAVESDSVRSSAGTEVEEVMIETSAAPVQESWEAFMRRVREAVGGCAAPGKHAARSAMRHVERAFAVKEIDPEGAVFHAITAEEEVATAVFHALVRHKYAGAEALSRRVHEHKAGITLLFEALAVLLTEVRRAHGITARLVWGEDGDQHLCIALFAPWTGDRAIFPVPPLHFGMLMDGQRYDFTDELAKLASVKGAKSIQAAIAKRANLRNQVLYAAQKGIPSVNKPVDGFLMKARDRVYGHLAVFLLIDQYPERQDFVQQTVDAFLKILPRLKRNPTVRAAGVEAR